MKNAVSVDELQELRDQLHHIRQQSLAASRENDFRTVARLTTEAARLNRLIHVQDDLAGFSAKSLEVVDALAEISDEGRFDFPEVEEILGEPEPMPACQEAA
jgi:hypothetical protein